MRKDLNLRSGEPSIPKDWDTEVRFIKYEYGPFAVQPALPQEPTPTIGTDQPLKGLSLKAALHKA